jgi:putative two-component system response regulator
MSATILLVDGNLANRMDWEALLQNHGYKVFATNNGNFALKEFPRIQPDMVLMSDSLEGLSGFEVCRILKTDPQTRSTPVVMMMPSANATEKAEGLAAGADDFWARPGSRWEALSRVQSILQIGSYIDHQAEAVVVSLARSLKLKNCGTEGHSERLVGYALRLGESLELSANDLDVLRISCLVHDIGKVGVPDSILLKPGRLNESELAIMRQHPIFGESICAPLKAFRDALPLIRHHHEHMDGTGYPDGLIGDEIPLNARILQVADIYDALTTDRPYRKAMTKESALAVMKSEAHRGWLSPSLLGKFIDTCETESFLPLSENPLSAGYLG